MCRPRSWAELATGARLTLRQKTRQGYAEVRTESAQELVRDASHAVCSESQELSAGVPKVELHCLRMRAELPPGAKLSWPKEPS